MLVQIPYNRSYAVEYARKWALSRNPLFFDFTGQGGNCTNFVSQCLLAGSGVMDFTPTFGWFYRSVDDRAPAWSGVEQLYDFLTGSGDFIDMEAQGPFGFAVDSREQIEIGDIVQLANSSGDFYHTLIISEITDSDILVCAQSDNALDRPLSSYRYAGLRILHIAGVAIDIPYEDIFAALYNSVSIQSIEARALNVEDLQ
ncbi:MAG: amidase domain-containing protein [Clostridia bacterium]|nr:amidase domain-containing protein [Clostridia bacterium]